MHEPKRDEEHAAGPREATATPEQTSADTPPERDTLTELEEAAGRTLSDDLTREVTKPASPGDEQPAGQ